MRLWLSLQYATWSSLSTLKSPVYKIKRIMKFKAGFMVKNLREKAGLSQTELSEKSGLSIAAISKIEQGKRDMQLSSALKLAVALGVTIDYLGGVKAITCAELRLEVIKLEITIQKILELINGKG